MAKKSLPEIQTDEEAIVAYVKTAQEARSVISIQTVLEKTAITGIAEKARTIIRNYAEKNEYLGLLRINGGLQPARVEFRLDNGALHPDEQDSLETHYGTAMDSLFSLETAVTVQSISTVVADLIKQGKNPDDYLTISVKKGMDNLIKDVNGVKVDKAYMPKDGFLNTLNGIKHTLTPQAKYYTLTYLETALKPKVVLGSRAAAD